MSKSILNRSKKIKMIVSDVDGVLTDGKIYLDAAGEEMKVFCARDAFRVEVWLRAGGQMIWFTGRKSQGLIKRARELKVDLVFKSELTGGLFSYIKNKYQLEPEQVLYIGDDWSDLYYLSRSGLSIAPQNASTENKKQADWVTKTKGGEGVLAEVIERVMRAQGSWVQAVKAYSEKFIL